MSNPVNTGETVGDMKAIIVKYLGPTNNRGSRIKASAEGVKSITRSFDYSKYDHGQLDIAKELCVINNWPTDLVGGQLPNGDYVFCFKNQ